ncbi:MFS transporter [Salmonella enterica subsp. enterica serovar Enteritidis]|uniref:MFS transporter n=1 Tax=Salmonella enterica subsp. enterica serovar Napoli TaxID=1151001 RepID=A0A5I4JZJ2_SALET|nr:MFS transporter [Salmonella enterica]EBN0188936.1 MFS transporter [Salmonella enterica subsp. enterica serovar Enteritidis]EDT2118261.1 MFS transporter [Salmonella enterica subsp. enterica]EAA7192191.1 MFS transporter [Salmonella enterica subsp. enterica serovar Napoli]EAW0366140.1 MFS transporter [Salmonella enterica]EAX5129260.1 MFS transporter [Salmonella enterica]
MNPVLRRSTLALLASSLLLTIGRGATLPFMTIYLNRQYGLGVDLIGYALTSALTIGVVFSLGFGILADKFDKKRYMLLAIIAFACGFIAIPMVHNVVLVVLLFALINCAYSVFSTVLKAWFADNLTATTKTRIFSLNYTVLNIGWTVGPPLGTLLVMQSINLPFWLAAICSAFPLVFIQVWVTRSVAAKVVAVVLPVNAVIVVSLQYAVGRRLTAVNIRPMMTTGTVFFIAGLIGFIFSGDNLFFWGLSAAVFTIGEIIYAPGEYMLIDNIAPAGMKASYFSAQSLGWLGAAVNPLASGVILTTLPAWSLFVVLIIAIVFAWALMLKGMRITPTQQAITC